MLIRHHVRVACASNSGVSALTDKIYQVLSSKLPGFDPAIHAQIQHLRELIVRIGSSADDKVTAVKRAKLLEMGTLPDTDRSMTACLVRYRAANKAGTYCEMFIQWVLGWDLRWRQACR